METKITIKNRLNIWLITGDEVPELGSTCIAYPNPHEVAIFSPANAAAENQIVSINPPVNPIAISFKIIVKKFGRLVSWILEAKFSGSPLKIIVANIIVMTIRTGKIT